MSLRSSITKLRGVIFPLSYLCRRRRRLVVWFGLTRRLVAISLGEFKSWKCKFAVS